MSNDDMPWTLVSGGAQRLGAAIVAGLAAQKHNVLIHYNTSAAAAEQLAQYCRRQGVLAECLQGNFSSPDAVVDFLERLRCFPRVEHLINNVGNYIIKPLLETSAHEWYELWQVNVHAPFALIKALVPSIKNFRGAIINVGIAGLNYTRADIYSTAYTCSKSALWQMTKSLAKELAETRIRVNMVSPGYIENAVDLPNDNSILPMGRAATLQEVVRMIIFLLAKESAYITGQNIEVAGGVRL